MAAAAASPMIFCRFTLGWAGVPMDYYGVRDRFGVWLLSDLTIPASTAAQTPVDSLTLSDQPLVSLSDVEYIEQATGFLAFNSETVAFDSLRATIGNPTMSGLPFVVVADGVKIYMGGFFSPISSIRIPDPMVYTDSITVGGFTISAPEPGPTPPNDPRFDPRIVKVLTETGRFVPAGG